MASDGASAVEIALKMAFHYWTNRGRPAKTGSRVSPAAITARRSARLRSPTCALFRDTYPPLLRAGATVPSPDARTPTSGESARDVAERAARALDAHLALHHATTAALIVEPRVQGASGMAMHDPHYLARARELCTRHDVLLIADEIMTGFGRTGTLFAWEQAHAPAPDFLCLSKGTDRRLPSALLRALDRRRLRRVLRRRRRARFLHSHSYTGNALACRAALAVLDLFRDDDVIAGNRAKAHAGASSPRRSPRIRTVRAFPAGRDDRRVRRRDRRARTSRAGASREGLAREILLRPLGRTVYFMPPYVVTDDEFARSWPRTLAILDRA